MNRQEKVNTQIREEPEKKSAGSMGKRNLRRRKSR